MKLALASLTLAISALPFLGSTLCTVSWNMTNVPRQGLNDILFPIDLSRAPHTPGYYFAQQVAFTGQSSVAYAGLQPREDSGSSAVIHGVLSSFINGTVTTDPNCSKGADGGPGVSCAHDFFGSYADPWELVITRTDEATWAGKVVNSVNGTAYHIGSFTLPPGTGGIQESQIGFVEYYPWNTNSSIACADLPHTEVTFSPPTTGSSSVGYLVGSMSGNVDNCQSRVTQTPASGQAVRFGIS